MSETSWRVVGFLGQVVFASRFIVQWFQSERSGKSVVPMYFWYASFFGGLVMLSYAAFIQDPVFIVGQASGMVVYTRNIVLRRREGAALSRHV